MNDRRRRTPRVRRKRTVQEEVPEVASEEPGEDIQEEVFEDTEVEEEVQESSDEEVKESETPPTPEELPKPKVTVVPAEEKAPGGTLIIKENTPIMAIAEKLNEGDALMMEKKGDNYIMRAVKPDQLNRAVRPTDQEYDDAVLSKEYKEWIEEWRQLSSEEKIAEVKRLDIPEDEWEHENDRMRLMRATNAVREHKNVEKYKPEYRTRKARKALRDYGIYAKPKS